MHNLNSMYNRLNQMFSSTAYRLRNLLSEESCMLQIECSYTAGCLQCITLYSIMNIILLYGYKCTLAYMKTVAYIPMCVKIILEV